MNSTCELCRHSARALKPYPAYKDSRIEWLREVPEHWQVRRLKTLCSRSALYGANVAATSYTTAGVRFLRTTDITEDGQLNGRGVFLPRESVDNYLLADGDVLISRSGTIGRSFLYERRIHGPCAYAGYLVRFVPAPIAVHDGFVRRQRRAAPVRRDVAEEPVLDLVPLARPGWEMTHLDGQAGPVSEPLKFLLPGAGTDTRCCRPNRP